MASRRTNAKNKRTLIAVLAVIIAVLLIVLVVIYFVKPALFHKFLGTGEHEWSEWTVTTEATCGKDGEKWRDCTVCGEKQTDKIPATGNHDLNGDNVCSVCGFDNNAPSVEVVSNSELSIHFLELGNGNAGDSTLIKCGDTEVLIDAGSKRNSTSTVKNYIDKYCTDGKLEYVIATHAHEDHIAALVGEEGKNNGVLYSYEIGTVIHFTGHKTTSQLYNDFDIAVKQLKSNGTSVYTAKQCWYETDGAKKTYYLDAGNNISLNILYQKYYDTTTSNDNNYSVCTLLTQKISENKTYNYLFTGDLEKAGEESLVSSNSLPEVELFKAGHHGSETSSNDVLLSVIKPKQIAICTCCGAPEYTLTDENMFPYQVTVDRMAKYTENIFVTTIAVNVKIEYDNNGKAKKSWGYASMNGDIVYYSTGGVLKRWCSNNDTVLKDTDWFKEHRTWNG